MGASHVSQQIGIVAVCHIGTQLANVRLGTHVNVHVFLNCILVGKSLDRHADRTDERLLILGGVMIQHVLFHLFLLDLFPALFAANLEKIVRDLIFQLLLLDLLFAILRPGTASRRSALLFPGFLNSTQPLELYKPKSVEL